MSALVHYFTLVAVMWMGAEALFMFQKLVIVFVQITTKYIIIVSVVCWGKSLSLSLFEKLIDNIIQAFQSSSCWVLSLPTLQMAVIPGRTLW